MSAYELEALPLPRSETLKQWSLLDNEEFNRAVAVAYRPVS